MNQLVLYALQQKSDILIENRSENKKGMLKT